MLKLTIKIGAKSASRWRATKVVELKDWPQYEYVGATWLEDSGTGQTQRTARIDYDDLDEIIELLSHVRANKTRRERKHAARLKEARSALAAGESVFSKKAV